MKKLLFIAVLAITAISCDKDKDDNTNSIEGRWLVNEQVESFTMTGSVFVPGFPPFTNDTTIVYDSSSTTTLPADSLYGEGIDLSNGTAIFFDEDGNYDTTTYTYSNNILSLEIIEGGFTGNDTTYEYAVSNLTSSTMEISLTISLSESGLTSTYSETSKLIK